MKILFISTTIMNRNRTEVYGNSRPTEDESPPRVIKYNVPVF